MNKNESEFLAKLMATFKIEAEEHLKALSGGLLSIEEKVDDPQRKEIIDTLFREAHSLKGAARAVNFDSIQSICQSLENVLAAWKQERLQISRDSFDTFYASIDLITKLIQLPSKDESKENRDTLSSLIERLDQIQIIHHNALEPLQRSPTATSASDSISNVPSPTTSLSEVQETSPTIPVSTETPIFDPPHLILEEAEAAGPPTASSASGRDKTIRVSQRKLDHLFQEVEEMLMLKLAARKQINDLKSMQDQIKLWEKKWGGVLSDYFTLREGAEINFNVIANHKKLSNLLQFLEWQSRFMKSFKGTLDNLSKISAQEFRQAGSIVDTLIDDTRRILMQPFSALLEPFPRMIRDISHSQNKEVHFEAVRTEIEVDRRILEEMKDPLMHLIRNGIDHGIELPAMRLKQNKPTCGSIKIVASQLSGNSIEILVIDDGRGVDLDKVKESVIKMGLMSKKEAAALSEQETLKLLFQSEVSTSSIITEISGRGIGLEIVAEKVDKLGGQVSVETQAGKGTTFRIILPLTLTSFRGMRLKVCDTHFIIPSHNVKKVIHVKDENLNWMEGRQILSVENVPIAYFSLNDILQISKKTIKSHNYAIIIKSAEKTVALGIDEAICEQEMLVKPFGQHLKRTKNIMGATITESGEVILILNPQDLIKASAKSQVGNACSPRKSEKISKKSILVVEDSMTSRMLLKSILETAGFDVKVAVDGMEGLSLFKLEPFDLILSDIEMPNMDGFTMTSHVRGLDRGKTIPIVLCTSRNTNADKEKGIDVGANAYLEKSNFTQTKFLEVINKLL